MTKKIHIVHVIPTLDMGGAERLLLDIVKRADKEVFALTVICFVRGGLWAEEIKQAGAELIILEKKNKFDLANLVKLWRALKKAQPDLIHTHLGGDIYGRWLGQFLRVPIVSTEHNLNKDESWLVRLLKRSTASAASLIIAVSQAVAKDASQRYKIAPDKIKVIYNGLDILRFKPVEIFKTLPIKIGAVGRLVEQKNFSVLIKALSLLKTKDFTCMIAGAGPLKDKLQAEINNLALNHKVYLSGLTNNMPEFLSQLDIFVLPSAWEGLGIAALEAGASGLPVVAAEVDGLTEIIDDGLTGLLFSSNNANQLASKIDYLIDHQTEARVLGVNLYNKVIKNFDVVNMVRQYELVYRSLIK